MLVDDGTQPESIGPRISISLSRPKRNLGIIKFKGLYKGTRTLKKGIRAYSGSELSLSNQAPQKS